MHARAHTNEWKGAPIFLSEVLIGADVGLLPIADSIWSISFSSVRIGYLDELNRAAVNRRPSTTKTVETDQIDE